MSGKKLFDAILFDLDGTLIHLPQEQFSRDVTLTIARLLAPKTGVSERDFVAGLIAGIEAMIANDGKERNDEVFYKTACARLGGDRERIDALFIDFYKNEFNSFKAITSENPFVGRALRESRRLADRVILATLPVFPKEAQKQRLSWIGLTPDCFDLVTDYSNCCYSKPSKEYYQEILREFSLDPARCIMVGNDVSDDILPALSLGMRAYLVTDCLLNGALDRPGAKEGSFEEFTNYLERL